MLCVSVFTKNIEFRQISTDVTWYREEALNEIKLIAYMTVRQLVYSVYLQADIFLNFPVSFE